MARGVYEWTFHVGDYFAAAGATFAPCGTPFLGQVCEIARDCTRVPALLPWPARGGRGGQERWKERLGRAPLLSRFPSASESTTPSRTTTSRSSARPSPSPRTVAPSRLSHGSPGCTACGMGAMGTGAAGDSERRARRERGGRPPRQSGSRGGGGGRVRAQGKCVCTWSTWSAVINLTSRAGELRSAPSGPDDRHRVTLTG